MLFKVLCQCYLDDFVSHKKTAAEDRRIIDTYLLPTFGKKEVAEIKYPAVHSFHAKMRRTPYQANRALSLLSRLIHTAQLLETPGVTVNPCHFVRRYPEKKRRRYLTATEVQSVIAAIDRRFDKKPLHCALLLLEIFTGARPKELKTATWAMLQGNSIEHEDTKTGQRTIHLSPHALAVLARLPRSRQWIIGPDVNARYVWASVLDETGMENLRMYDLRHSFASFGLGLGMSLAQIGELLGHSTPVTTARYAHLEQKRGQDLATTITEGMYAQGS